MKTKNIIIVALLVITALAACKKLDEVPPKTDTTSTKNYNLPRPTVLTQEERDFVLKERQEYNELTTD
ncbi:MAG: hypothetical protein LBE37_03340 [Sphingobacterium sp.]|jgi:outer membrane protein assembly factor BamE (lipoprotein component of BamABCDE complex)|nr:hypothetical protein [Sphingobacterium sp.]